MYCDKSSEVLKSKRDDSLDLSLLKLLFAFIRDTRWSTGDLQAERNTKFVIYARGLATGVHAEYLFLVLFGWLVKNPKFMYQNPKTYVL